MKKKEKVKSTELYSQFSLL